MNEHGAVDLGTAEPIPEREPVAPTENPEFPTAQDEAERELVHAIAEEAKAETDEAVEMVPTLIKELDDEIMQRLNALAPYQLGVDLAATMFDTIVDLMAPEGTIERAALGNLYRSKVKTVLDALEASLGRMRLLQGVPGVPPM